MTGATAAAHGNGSNHANAAPPDLPTQERTTDVEAWRKRMEDKGAAAAVHRRGELAASRSAGVGRGDRVTPLPTTPDVPKPKPRAAPARRVDPDQARQLAIVTAYLAGDSTVELASRYGCSPTTIANLLRGADVQLRRAGKAVLSPEQVAAMVDAYVAGEACPALAERFGCSSATVHKHLTAAGVQMRPSASGSKAPLPAETVTAIVDAYVAGDSSAAIAERFGCSSATVHKYLSAAGVVRPRGQARPRADHAAPGEGLEPLTPAVEEKPARHLEAVPERAQPTAPSTTTQPPGVDAGPIDRGRLELLAQANPALGASIDPDVVLARLADDVGVVLSVLQDVVDTTEELLQAQRAVAALRVRRLRDLAAELLTVLTPAPSPAAPEGR